MDLVDNSVQDIALIAVVAIAPLAIVIIIALLRGYRIEVKLHRNGRGDRE